MLKNKYFGILVGVIFIVAVLFIVVCINGKKSNISSLNSTTSIQQINNTTDNTMPSNVTSFTVQANADTGETDEVFSNYIKNIKNAVSGNNRNIVWAYVNNRPINKWLVLYNKTGLDMGIEKNLNVIGNNEEQRKQFLEKYQKTEDEVLDINIKYEVIKQEAEKIGIKLKDADVLKDAKAQILAYKQWKDGFFDKILNAFGYTEEQYLNNIAIPAVKINSFYHIYFQKVCPVESYKNTEIRTADFDKKYQQLIKKYNIKKLK